MKGQEMPWVPVPTEEMLKTHPHLKEFLPYLELLNKESDRGKVLISTGYIEEQLKRVLLAFMRDTPHAVKLVEGGNAPLGTLSARIAACHSLGLVNDDEHHDLTLLRKIRNDFAHSMHTTFKTPSVVSRCKELRLKAHDYSTKERAVVVKPSAQFQSAAMTLLTNFVNRAHHVGKHRVVPIDWPY